jgi:hypothetical protein
MMILNNSDGIRLQRDSESETDNKSKSTQKISFLL